MSRCSEGGRDSCWGAAPAASLKVCLSPDNDRTAAISRGPLCADSVAKLFWAPERATLIQDQPPPGNVDSEMCSSRFDYCWPANRPGLLQHYLPRTDSCTAANDIFRLQYLARTRITSHPRTHQCMQRDDSLAHVGCPCAVLGGFWSGGIDSSTAVGTGRCSTATGFGRIAARYRLGSILAAMSPKRAR